jgi:hypothetical protein
MKRMIPNGKRYPVAKMPFFNLEGILSLILTTFSHSLVTCIVCDNFNHTDFGTSIMSSDVTPLALARGENEQGFSNGGSVVSFIFIPTSHYPISKSNQDKEQIMHI